MRNIIPDFILKQYCQKKFKGNFKAVAMFLDISGFTPMTEELMKNGKEGVEVLSDIISNIFSPAIDIVHSNGGFISTFAGDAFTAIFEVDGNKDKDLMTEHLLLAEKIKIAFKKISSQKTKFGNHNLSLKLGMSFGDIDWGIIMHEKKLHYYFKGEAIDQSAENQQDACNNEIIFDEIVRNNINEEWFEIAVKGKEIKTYKLLNSKQNKKKLPHKLENNYDSVSDIDFSDCVHKSISEMNSHGEFREVAICAVSFEPT
ncbi:MAG: adenylate/guanylate cyclase domain-containing protein, partial [Candidatus Delongbacteria bacterium]|nr:adenylate/guanylate cyclase domain-containing protein [Candidatus Delongbacteria bacterium]